MILFCSCFVTQTLTETSAATAELQRDYEVKLLSAEQLQQQQHAAETKQQMDALRAQWQDDVVKHRRDAEERLKSQKEVELPTPYYYLRCHQFD